MAIQFARIKIHSRKNGANACRTSAYNARSKITDEKTGEVFDFTKKGGNVYHQVLLPEGANEKFKDISILSNAIEKREKKSNSQLLKEAVIALPDDDEFTLEDRINITHLVTKEMGWVENGLAVQIDIHEPDNNDNNWHAHVAVLTTRFTKCGNYLGEKARDLNPEFKTGKGKSFIVPEEDIIHEKLKRIINDYCRERGYQTRVDPTGKVAQEHIGPVRMRSLTNPAIDRNEEKIQANIEYLNSGKRVIEHVTNNSSVFNKSDLYRAVKIVPDAELREQLVNDALSSKSLVVLHDDNGKENGYYTTVKIRAEEKKILRLSSSVFNQKNILAEVCSNTGGIRELLKDNKSNFSPEQEQALSNLVFDEQGIRILRGRAGTGKSYVLGAFGGISKKFGINVIGLAPTHKAKNELASCGYEQVDTVKGILFKLYNGQCTLPKHSVIVVDEAGMIGNDDFKELFRIAATHKCNVILSGDEKQLASVQRGGMFEVSVQSYGSSLIHNIQRQKNAWGRDVAMAFSKGEVSTGIAILQKHNKLITNTDKIESMQRLLADWNQSKEKIVDRLIIAVKNSDVDMLNHGARQYLKSSGVLHGEEISVSGNHYMAGDRVLIKATNKKLGLLNGDFATIKHVSKERFVISVESNQDKSNKDNNDNSKLVEFSPAEYNGFRHGYATTICKAQGASIFVVFVLHNGFAGIRNSYVALSRNVKNVKLYINNQATKSVSHLIKQLGHDPEIGSSLIYLSAQDLRNRQLAKAPQQERGMIGSLVTGVLDYTSRKFTEMVDKHIQRWYQETRQANKDKF